MADNKLIDSLNLDSFDFGDFDTLETGVTAQRQPVSTPEVSNIVTNLKKRAMVVFFIVDISGSMKGARIGAVNDAIRNVLPELKKKERGNTSAEIRVAILEFSTRAVWRTFFPEPVSSFQYSDIEHVGGGTNYGSAFAALNEKLSRRQFMSSSAGAYTPLIIFMTDGKPSDMGLYPEELAKLKQNKWFRYATRAGIAIEEGALSPECKRVLLEITENEKNVYEAKNTVVLAKQIELVTLAGVDFVTQQGSVQNSAADSANAAKNTPVSAINGISLSRLGPRENGKTSPETVKPVQVGQASQAGQGFASPTLPTGEIDWENDFNF